MTTAQLKADIKSRFPKRNKYGAHKTEYNGRKFDSKAEAAYAKRLDWLMHAHELKDRVMAIEYQVCFPVYMKNIHVFDYFCDFKVQYGDGRVEIIDVKSPITEKDPVFRIKKKSVEAYYGIEIKIVMET